jgi:phosphosulfolactate phosphohydrolase-like enzyme
MNNTNGSEVMKQVEKQQLLTAFARVVNVDSTVAYMESLMTFLAKGSETGGRFPPEKRLCCVKPANGDRNHRSLRYR